MRKIISTNEEIRKMVTLFEDGKSLNEISETVGKSASTVKRMLANCGLLEDVIDKRAWENARLGYYGKWEDAPFSVKTKAFDREKQKLLDVAKFYKEKIMSISNSEPIVEAKNEYGIEYIYQQLIEHKDEFKLVERINKEYKYINIKHGYKVSVLMKEGKPNKMIIS